MPTWEERKKQLKKEAEQARTGSLIIRSEPLVSTPPSDLNIRKSIAVNRSKPVLQKSSVQSTIPKIELTPFEKTLMSRGADIISEKLKELELEKQEEELRKRQEAYRLESWQKEPLFKRLFRKEPPADYQPKVPMPEDWQSSQITTPAPAIAPLTNVGEFQRLQEAQRKAQPGFGNFQVFQNEQAKDPLLQVGLLTIKPQTAQRIANAYTNADLKADPRYAAIGQGLPENIKQAFRAIPLLPSKEGLQYLPGEVKERVIDKPGAPSWGEVLTNTIKSGLAQTAIGVTKTADLLIPENVYKFLTGSTQQEMLNLFEQRQREAQESMQGAGLLKDIVYTGGSAVIPTAIDVKLGELLRAGTAVSQFGPWTIKNVVDTVARGLPFFQRSFGLYAREAELEGANRAQQAIYGLAGATVETITELPIVEKFYGGVASKLPIKAIMKTGAKRILTAPMGQAVVQGLYNAGLETGQEILAGLVSGAAKKAIYDKTTPLIGKGGVIDPSRIGEDAYGGFAMSLVMFATGLPGNYASYQKAASIMQKAQKGEKITAQELVDLQMQIMDDVSSIEQKPQEQKQVIQQSVPESVDVDVAMQAPVTEQNLQTLDELIKSMKADLQEASTGIAALNQQVNRGLEKAQQIKAGQEATVRPVERPGAQQIQIPSTSAQNASITITGAVKPAAKAPDIPVGTKVTLGKLGEVEVISEVDDKKVRIRKSDGKELDVLKVAVAKAMASKAPTVEKPNTTQVQSQGQAAGNASTGAQYGQTGQNLFNRFVKELKINLNTDAGKKFREFFEKYYNQGLSGNVDEKIEGSLANLAQQFRNAGIEDRQAQTEKEPPKPVKGAIDERDWIDAGNRKVKAISNEYPDLKPFIQDEAKNLLTELRNAIKGERFAVPGQYGSDMEWTGTKRMVNPVLEPFLDKGYSYREIETALKDIINGNGGENKALAKRLELAIDDALVNGTTLMDGTPIPANADYIAARNRVHSSQAEQPAKTVQQAVDELKPYAENVIKSGKVKSISLIGSIAEKGRGNDIDLLYDFGDMQLPENEKEAIEKVTEILEGLEGADYESYDSFFKFGNRYFHLSSGAGNEIVENTGYAKEQAGKPMILLAGKAETAQQASETPKSGLPEGVRIRKTNTNYGNTVWEVSGVSKNDTDLISALKSAGGRWYGPKRVWSFYGAEDPTQKIIKEIKKIEDHKAWVDKQQENAAKTSPTAQPQELKQPETAVLPEFGRAGNAAFKKWTASEYINAKPGTEHYDKWVKVFDAYYQRGLSGQPQYRWGESPVLKEEVEFPPFIFDEIYKAGKTDYEAQQKRETAKQQEKSTAINDTNVTESGIIKAEEPESATNKDLDSYVAQVVVLDDWLKKAVKNTDKETVMPEIERRIRDAIVDKLASYEDGIPQDVVSWYNSRTAKNGQNEYITSIAERVYEQLKGGNANVRTADQTKSERVPAETIPATSPNRGTSRVPGNQREGSRGEVRSDREDVSGSVSGTGDIRGESAAQQLDTVNDNQAGTRGNTSAGRSGNVTTASAGNFRITDDAEIGKGGIKTKYKDNIAAIKLLKQIEAENRKATPEEQKVLARYVGWGGMPQAFDESNKSWAAEYNELKGLLTEEEYKAARASTPNAHYTDIPVIKAIYNAVQRLGFDGGKILEPAVGVGNFIGAAPDNLRSSKFTGVELDSITGRIATQLYQDAKIHVKGFEEVKIPDNFFDLAISNVPFGNYKLHDPKYNKYNFFIHDYFFAKTLDKVRPGGIVAFITSKGTMDKKDSKVREYISERADLIGAIRLPNTTFQKNANTSVTTDVIFLQKRAPGQPAKGESWLNISETADGVPVNEYYVNHPEMMLGTMVFDKSMYGNEKETSLNPLEGDLLEAMQKAIEKLPQNIMPQAEQQVETPDFNTLAADTTFKENSYVYQDGTIYQNINGILHPVMQNSRGKTVPVSGKRKERIIGMIQLRNALRDVFDTQRRNADEAIIKAARDKLNKVYDNFVKRYGHIEDTANKLAFGDDPDYWLITTLEKYNPDTGEYEKADIMSKRTIMPNLKIDKVGTASEALAVTLNEKGKIDLARMAQLVGKSENEVIKDLHGIIFKNPVSGAWETSDSYLSGNVREKLRQAREAAEKNPEYLPNVQALEKVQPEDLKAHQIAVRLGANWIGADTVEEFVRELLETDNVRANYIDQAGSWTLKAYPTNTALYANKYGTRRMSAQNIIEKLLNMQQINVYDTLDDGTRVLNKKETAAAREKAEVIKREFSQWIYKDPERRQKLERLYNETFNNLNLRKYDGSFLTFPGMSSAIKLRDYQKDVVARILFGGNTLIAHAVGAGKTFEMIAAGMELKRLHIAHKPAYIVPNHMIEQWRKDFLKLYPNANILAATKKDFEKDSRARFISMIATGDWDAVIISHSSFGKIGVSRETEAAFIQEEIDDVVAAIQAAKAEGGNDPNSRRTVKELEKLKKNLESSLKKLLESESKDSYIDFEDLGIDYLFVDEAHNFKNLFFHTKMGRIAGVSNSKAKRAADMYMKVKYITGLHNNERGVVFATGTPISNSMPEMFTMQRYLAMPALERAGLKHFDAWASTFGEVVSALEVDKTGKGFRTKQRFSRFFNAPELVTMFRDFADVITSDMLNIERPTVEGGKPKIISVEPSQALKDYIEQLVERSDAVASGMVDPKEDNALKITNDGRLAALDMRLIDPNLPDDPNSKLNQAVEVIFKEWEDGKAERTTQLVFSDLGTPKDNAAVETEQIVSEEDDESAPEDETAPGFAVNFDIYNDVKQKLIKMGVPENEIAFIHDAKTDLAKAKLFEKVRRGEVRILIGSTAKMGEGTNVQDRLIALHHLDAPWKPSSVEQRNGRIIRAGNRHKQVRIYHYVTKGSFDAYIWQLIENKARFISQMMNNKLPGRQIEDAFDEVVLNSAEIKAAASQDPRIMEKVKIDQEINRLEMLKSSHMSEVYDAQDYLARMPAQIAKQKQYIESIKQDIPKITDTKGDKFSIRLNGKIFTERKEAGKIILDATATAKFNQPASIGSISGFELLVDKDAWANPRIIIRGANDYFVQPTATEVGTVTSIETAIRNLPDKLTAEEKHLQVLNDRYEGYKELANKPFEHEERLNELYQKQAEINNALNLERPDNVMLDEVEESADVEDMQASSGGVRSRAATSGILEGMQPERSTSSGTKSKSAATARILSSTATGAQSTTSKPVSRQEIVDFVSEFLDIPVKYGKFRERALGIFKEQPEIIRLKNPKDIETLYHELGHFLDKKLNLLDQRFRSELEALGLRTSKPSYTVNEVMQEGIAEFVAHYTADPITARAKAPQFFAYFNSKLTPDLRDMFKTLQAATRNYVNQDPIKRIQGNISLNGQKPSIGEKINLTKIYTEVFENIYPLYKGVKKITGGVKLEAQNDPYLIARLNAGAMAKAEGILEFGPVDAKNNKIGKGLNEILDSVDDLNEFRVYIVSKRAIELHKNGIETGLLDSDVRYAVQKLDSKYSKAAQELLDYQNKMMHQLVDSGILSEADYQNIINAYSFYVPFYRVIDKSAGAGTGKGFEAKDPIKRIKGSMRDIIDPLESIIKNTFVFTLMSERNKVGRAFAELAEKYEGSGKLMDKVPPRMVPKSFTLDVIKKVLEESGANTTEMDLESIATVFTPMGYTPKDNVITIFLNGKPTYYQVFDEDFYIAFKALDYDKTPKIIQLLSIPAKTLRAGATGLNVDFISRNIFRDTFTAAINSPYNFLPFIDSIRGLFHVLNKSEVFQKWLYAGGGSSEMIAIDRKHIQEAYHKLLKENTPLNIIRHPVEFLRLWSEFSEQATRVGVFAKGLKKEGDSLSGQMLAAIASREATVDFARFGSSIKNANKLIAFFNASIQGIDVLARAIARNPLGVLGRSFLYITLPSIAFYFLNRDDPEYEEMPQYQKDLFWLLKVNGTWYRIPKPPVIGMFAGSLVERALAFLDKEDPDAFKGFTDQFLGSVLPNWLPTAMQPWLEVWSKVNKDFFRNVPIVPESELYLEPSKQYGPYTSSFAKFFGKMFNVSPRKVDHIIKGYFGGVGQAVADIAGKGLEIVGAVEKKIEPEKGLTKKLPVIRGLTVDSYRNPKSIDDFYNALDELETHYKRVRDEKGIELDQFKHKDKLRALRKTEELLRDLRKEYNRIYADNTITSKEKQEKLSKINIRMINEARKALGKPIIKDN